MRALARRPHQRQRTAASGHTRGLRHGGRDARGLRQAQRKQAEQAGIEFHVNGHQQQVLAHVFNVTFPGTDVESFLINLDMAGVLVSSGSACTAGSIDPSHVLVAMFGENAPELRSSIRFSFGLGLTNEQIREAGKRTAAIVKRLTQ